MAIGQSQSHVPLNYKWLRNMEERLNAPPRVSGPLQWHPPPSFLSVALTLPSWATSQILADCDFLIILPLVFCLWDHILHDVFRDHLRAHFLPPCTPARVPDLLQTCSAMACFQVMQRLWKCINNNPPDSSPNKPAPLIVLPLSASSHQSKTTKGLPY